MNALYHQLPLSMTGQPSKRAERVTIDPGWLQAQYLDRGLSAPQIAALVGCGRSLVYQRLAQIGVPSRDKSSSSVLRRGNHVCLSAELLEILDGELLGDGCLQSVSAHSARYEHTSKHRSYLDWLNDQFVLFGFRAAKVDAMKNKVAPYYRYRTRHYIELLQVKERWYPDGRKAVPSGITLSPITVRQWFIGDASVAQKGRPGQSVTFHTEGFSPFENQRLADRLQDVIGAEAAVSRQNTVRLPSASVAALYAYMTPCPKELMSVYGYKFSQTS